MLILTEYRRGKISQGDFRIKKKFAYGLLIQKGVDNDVGDKQENVLYFQEMHIEIVEGRDVCNLLSNGYTHTEKLKGRSEGATINVTH